MKIIVTSVYLFTLPLDYLGSVRCFYMAVGAKTENKRMKEDA